MESILQGGKWAILAVVVAGCGQAAATAPGPAVTEVAASAPESNIVSAGPAEAAAIVQAAIAQLPAGPSPRGWAVAFTGGPLDGQTQIVPRVYPVTSHTVGMGGGTHILGQNLVIVGVHPTKSFVNISVLNGGGFGEVVGTAGATSFSGSGTFSGPSGAEGFSATVTEIP